MSQGAPIHLCMKPFVLCLHLSAITVSPVAGYNIAALDVILFVFFCIYTAKPSLTTIKALGRL